MWFMTMWGKQILARPIEFQKENWGVAVHFLEIMRRQLFLKTAKKKKKTKTKNKAMNSVFFSKLKLYYL